jgi:ribosomal protein S18 acetylase RimI-like enzyme
MVKYVIDKECISLSDLTNFVKFVDKDFTPPLLGRVDIDAWLSKIYATGSIVLAMNDDDIIGCLLFYANDLTSKEGYISYLVVDARYRGLGIAKSLLNECFKISRCNGMTIIKVFTNNPIASSLYQQAGFDVVSEEPIKEFGVVNVSLKKIL